MLAPADPAIEVKFITCHNEKTHYTVLKFYMHVIMEAHVEHNRLIYLLDTVSEEKSD